MATNQNTISIPEFWNKHTFLEPKLPYLWLRQFKDLGLITTIGNHITDTGRKLILKYSKIIVSNAEDRLKKYGVKLI